MKRMILAIAMLLAIVATVGLLTLLSFAEPQSGDQCTTDYDDTLVGSDGGYFFRDGVQASIKYYADGSIGSFSHENYSGPRQHYVIMPDGEADYYGYCIEQGESFPDSQRYFGVGWVNDSYFSKLPTTVQNGIMLATIFGWQPGKTVPVPGCNEDDWYWATQVIIWEYQQQLRTSPSTTQSNGHVSANYFQSTLDGRPAEKCYNMMLDSMAKFQVIPSFTTTDSANPPVHVLKWDTAMQRWSTTLNDTNHTGAPLIADESSLKIEHNDNQYTFYSATKLDITTVHFIKDVPLPSHEMLIWGGANTTQAITTGAADPVNFYANFRAEQLGLLEIVKTAEDDQLNGFKFIVENQNGLLIPLETNQEGIASAQLYPGDYLVSEEQTFKYRCPEPIAVEIKENETAHVEISNVLKKGKVQIQKTLVDTISNKTVMEKGAVFQVYPKEYLTYDRAPQSLRDEIKTDEQGNAMTKELPLGNYMMHQTYAGKNRTISQDSTIVIENDMATVFLPIENQVQKGKIQILKNNNAEQYLEGAVFTIRAAEDISMVDGTSKYMKGSLVDTITTDAKGMAGSNWLYPGQYFIEEIKAPEGYEISKSPVTSVLLSTDVNTSTTFIKQITIKNNRVVEFPMTGDVTDRVSTRATVILMLLSLIGIGILAYLMKEQNKTLH